MSTSPRPIAIINGGLVTSVGLSMPAACAAIRAGLTNHTETRFTDANGEWIPGAQVSQEQPWRGGEKLFRMLTSAVDECLEPFPDLTASGLALLICVAEEQRPGRIEGIENLVDQLCSNFRFDRQRSAVIAYGRVGAAVGLARARTLLYESGVAHVVLAAADSLLVGGTLESLDKRGRLLSVSNSNGFIPGEGAGALLLSKGDAGGPHLICAGLGFAEEVAAIDSEHPFRADGLTKAIIQSLTDAGCRMHDVDFRITDNSGEHYYFREAALALTRTMRERKPEFPFWHPADCIGETGATSGIAGLAVALTACRKAYAPGRTILLHCGNDGGERAAVIVRYGSLS